VLEIVWRVEALALPPLALPCARCARVSSFHCTEKFRVNANGGLLDVWLLYRCAACAEVHKARVLRRVAARSLAREALAGYQGDDAALVRAAAFELARGAEVPHRVVRPPLPASGSLRARVVQPEPCGARWDRLLARELGVSRAQLQRAAERGAIRVNGAGDLARAVRDGDALEVDEPRRGGPGIQSPGPAHALKRFA
jgi:hypothetical protein